MKHGILLAGGSGTRLSPLNSVINKHLLSINGKFIIDYPINTLKQMGVENLTVILGGNHFSQVVDHLKDGSSVGMKINYLYQGDAKGIAHAVNLTERFTSPKEPFVVILGDNVYSNPIVWSGGNARGKAQIALFEHSDLQRFGVASIDKLTDEIQKIEEKPQDLDTQYNQYAITGCYLFDYRFFDYFEKIKPSERGEFEITDILWKYLEHDLLHHTWVGGFWSDAGTHQSIAQCNQYFYQQLQNH
jgi:glucose-1-phosphate thymidylyltransferase